MEASVLWHQACLQMHLSTISLFYQITEFAAFALACPLSARIIVRMKSSAYSYVYDAANGLAAAHNNVATSEAATYRGSSSVGSCSKTFYIISEITNFAGKLQ